MKIIRRNIIHNYRSKQHPPFIQEILAKRNITSEEDFDLSLRHLHPYHDLSNIEEATALVVDAIEKDRKILLVGDYDVDGATSIALAMRILREFGAKNVTYRVPHRVLDGYGLSRTLVQKILQDNKPDLLITLDNGISNVEGVALAKEKGIDVLITDHHLPPEELPAADAIVNPNLVGDPFPSKALAGVGVIFYLLLSIRAALIESGSFTRETAPNLARYLDIVAVGTIADMVPLDSNNRRLVQQGLARIRSGATIAGISSLIRITGRNQRNLSTTDIGFTIGPLLNAAGRIDNMTIGIEALLSDDPNETDQYARELYQLNQERKALEQEARVSADEILDELTVDESDALYSISLYDEAWHQGITGIVASRIKDQYFRPTFIFAYDSEGMIKGSGRSIDGIHLRDMISNVATENRGLIATFGGHAMAAGLSLPEDHFEDFKQLIDKEIAKHADHELFEQILLSDGSLPMKAYNLRVAEQLKLAFPWGATFPEPLFDDIFEIVNFRILKNQHLKFMLKHPEYNHFIDGIAFFQAHQLIDNVTRIHCAFKLDINEWRGRRDLQLIIEHFEPLA